MSGQRGRPPKHPPSSPTTDGKPPLEERAQRNIFSTVKLLGRVIGSTEKLSEEEFEDIGRGIASLRLLLPKHEKDIENAIDTLGPAATVLDLADKLTRLFSKSKLKDEADKATAALQKRLEGTKSAG